MLSVHDRVAKFSVLMKQGIAQTTPTAHLYISRTSSLVDEPRYETCSLGAAAFAASTPDTYEREGFDSIKWFRESPAEELVRGLILNVRFQLAASISRDVQKVHAFLFRTFKTGCNLQAAIMTANDYAWGYMRHRRDFRSVIVEYLDVILANSAEMLSVEGIDDYKGWF